MPVSHLDCCEIIYSHIATLLCLLFIQVSYWHYYKLSILNVLHMKIFDFLSIKQNIINYRRFSLLTPINNEN